MVDKNEKESETTEQVESQIAAALLILISRNGAVGGLRACTLGHGSKAIDLVLIDPERRAQRSARSFSLRARNAIAARWAARKSDRGPCCARAPSSPTMKR